MTNKALFTFVKKKLPSWGSETSTSQSDTLKHISEIDEGFYNREFDFLSNYDRFLMKNIQFSERVYKRYSNINCPEWSRIHSPLNKSVESLREELRDEVSGQLMEFLQKKDFDKILPKRYIPELEEDDLECLHANLIPASTINRFIPTYETNTDYIVGHAPLKDEFSRFFHCIIFHKVSIVVVLEKLEDKRKMDKWWPDSENPVLSIENGKITLNLLSEKKFGSFTERKIKATSGSNTYDFILFHFEKWPDFGIPSLDQFNSLISSVTSSLSDFESKKIFVHCSAGIGRTSTLVSSLILQEQANNHLSKGNESFTIHLPLLICVLKYHRPGMTQTNQQYMFPSKYIQKYIEDNYAEKINILHDSFIGLV